MKDEDGPSLLLDEWAELLQPNRIILLDRLEDLRSQGFQPDTKDCRQLEKFDLMESTQLQGENEIKVTFEVFKMPHLSAPEMSFLKDIWKQ